MKRLIFQICFLFWTSLLLASITTAKISHAAAGADLSPRCDIAELARLEADFQRITQIRAEQPEVFSESDYKIAALNYIAQANTCYYANLPAASPSPANRHLDPLLIDNDGAWARGFGPPPGSEEFNTFGQKWGPGSPFIGGQNQPGPGLAGGVVTYSYMGTGVSHSYEGLGGNTNVRTSLGVNGCVEAEIDNAFTAWSAVADIQFIQVSDNGAASNGAGAAGDIRIGAHPFDGPLGVLAHAYFPPPNGASIAGDLHFDSVEAWSCTSGGGKIDIGLVALHEIGHAIGLRHEPLPSQGGNPAVMNAYYNSGLTNLLLDDFNGAASIYGSGQPLTLDKTLLTSFSQVTAFAALTYKIEIKNLSPQPVSNISVGDIIPAQANYIAGSADASPAIVDLTNFPTSTPSFTLNGNNSVQITYEVELGLVEQGDLLTGVATLNAPVLPQPLQVQHTAIVEPRIVYLPLLRRSIW